MQYLGRTALSKRIFTGLQPRRLGKLVVELAGAWMAAEESRLRERRGHERMRAPGAGPDRELAFVDRVVVTLVDVFAYAAAEGVELRIAEIGRAHV